MGNGASREGPTDRRIGLSDLDIAIPFRPGIPACATCEGQRPDMSAPRHHARSAIFGCECRVESPLICPLAVWLLVPFSSIATSSAVAGVFAAGGGLYPDRASGRRQPQKDGNPASHYIRNHPTGVRDVPHHPLLWGARGTTPIAPAAKGHAPPQLRCRWSLHARHEELTWHCH